MFLLVVLRDKTMFESVGKISTGPGLGGWEQLSEGGEGGREGG